MTVKEREYHDYLIGKGRHCENPEFVQRQERFAIKVIEKYRPRSIIDLGCGTGTLVKHFLQKGVNAFGVDSNSYNRLWFQHRNNQWADRIVLQDVLHYEWPLKYDVAIGQFILDQLTCVDMEYLIYEISNKSRLFIMEIDWRARQEDEVMKYITEAGMEKVDEWDNKYIFSTFTGLQEDSYLEATVKATINQLIALKLLKQN